MDIILVTNLVTNLELLLANWINCYEGFLGEGQGIFSQAGKRAGLNGSRSNLFYEAIRIIKEKNCISVRQIAFYQVLVSLKPTPSITALRP